MTPAWRGRPEELISLAMSDSESVAEILTLAVVPLARVMPSVPDMPSASDDDD